MDGIYQGKLLTVEYEEHDLDVIVIDPDGLGAGQFSIGLGFRMAEKYVGVSQPTLTKWSKGVITLEGVNGLKLPCGEVLRVHTVPGEDGNEYKVIEAKDWVKLAKSIIKTALKYPKRFPTDTVEQAVDFLGWYAAKGLYAASYTKLKGAYTQSDDNALTQSLQSANEELIAENELLKLRLEREMNQLLYKLDAIEETNSASGTNWRHWELEQAPIDF